METHRSATLVVALLVASAVCAAGREHEWPDDFDKNVAHWKEVALMPGAKNEWPAGKKRPFGSLSWDVYIRDGEVVATGDPEGDDGPTLPFIPNLNGDEKEGPTIWLAIPMAGGWIVCADLGEWGGKVIWFSRDGSRRIDISGDQINALIRTADGLFGVGSIAFDFNLIEIRQQPDGAWRTSGLTLLPQLQEGIASLGEHRLLVATRSKLFTYDVGGSLNELPNDVLPPQFHVQDAPASCHGHWAFHSDNLYWGLTHYVTEINLRTGARRYLVPDDRFVNDKVRWEATMDQMWHDKEVGLPPVSTATLLAKKQLIAKKLAVYEKLEAEGSAQLSAVRKAIERCYQQHGLSSKNPQNHDPFYKLIVRNSGRVQEIVFFGASPQLKACLSAIIQPFQFSPFQDDETVTISVTEFQCRVAERGDLFE